jgi:hypothetical protein
MRPPEAGHGRTEARDGPAEARNGRKDTRKNLVEPRGEPGARDGRTYMYLGWPYRKIVRD